MPLPLIPALLGGGALVATLFGAKKGYDAYQDTQEASRYGKRSKDLYDDAESELNNARERSQEHFETLGQLQASIVKNELMRYADIIDKLDVKGNVDFENLAGKETLGKLAEIRQSIISLETMLGAVVGSVATGTLAGFGAFGAAGLLASASTGTAISALSGVAATNATLAWFGGGSLAAGGLGMAGGSFVLGGIVAAPIIAVAASVFAASAEKKKYDAASYYHSIKAFCEAMKSEALAYTEILTKSKEKTRTLRRKRLEIQGCLEELEDVIEDKGYIVSTWDNEEQFILKTLMQVAETIVAVINAPVMNDDDLLTKQLMEHHDKCKELMDEIQRKWG
ncbi:hypothetical protein [Helicobacter trogontum]|uniref:Ancestral polypeptide n=1 Tax=Helicobacter trogontum TaxID=50960 RepID=A0A4U8TGL0_9HELI|nr:hypothetical protein [Helicobacter trogontum]TLD99319.1 hypothetical protein LS80_001355 [Helicobacter trogontum]